MIYALEILDSKFVKIGFSSNDDVAERIAALQTGSPFEIQRLFTIEGTLRQEKSIHAGLYSAFSRIYMPMPPNEWYPGRNQFFQMFLDALKSGANFGIAFAEKYNANVKQPSQKKPRDVVANIKWPKISRKENIYFAVASSNDPSVRAKAPW